jgi:hypothetical protein
LAKAIHLHHDDGDDGDDVVGKGKVDNPLALAVERYR